MAAEEEAIGDAAIESDGISSLKEDQREALKVSSQWKRCFLLHTLFLISVRVLHCMLRWFKFTSDR